MVRTLLAVEICDEVIVGVLLEYLWKFLEICVGYKYVYVFRIQIHAQPDTRGRRGLALIRRKCTLRYAMMRRNETVLQEEKCKLRKEECDEHCPATRA